MIRDEQNQEEMWKRSFEFLKDHLSPETVEKYGPLPKSATDTEKTSAAQPESAAEGDAAISGGEQIPGE